MNALHRTLQKLVDEAVEKQKHKNIQRWIPHFHVMIKILGSMHQQGSGSLGI